MIRKTYIDSAGIIKAEMYSAPGNGAEIYIAKIHSTNSAWEHVFQSFKEASYYINEKLYKKW